MRTQRDFGSGHGGCDPRPARSLTQSRRFFLFKALVSLAMGLCVPLDVLGQLPPEWFTTPLLKESVRRHQMYAFVNANIPVLPAFASLKQWQDYKAQKKPRILRQLGIDDILGTHKLNVIQKGVLERFRT